MNLSAKTNFSYTGRGTATSPLTVSHGSKPFMSDGAWRSPGFWQTALATPPRNDAA